MAERERRTKGTGQRAVAISGRRRLTKEDGKIAQLAVLKSSKGIVIPEVRKVIMKRRQDDARKTSRRSNLIYPSEMSRADWCPRATYYRMCGMPEPESSSSFTLENVFAEGNAIHAKWQGWLSDTGLLWGDWRCSRCSQYVQNSPRPDGPGYGPCVGTNFIRLADNLIDSSGFEHDWQYKEVTLRSTSLPISGHADGALIKHNCLIELKSVGVGTLRFDAPQLIASHTYEIGNKKILDIEGTWKDLHKPLLAHVKQGNIYLWIARELGLPFDSIVFVYEFKANQQVKEFRVSLSEEILSPMLDKAELITMCLSQNVAPPCPHGGCANCRAYEKGLNYA